jgi:hypothetical protein
MSTPAEPSAPSFEAEYLLETPVICAGCAAEITSVGAVRLIRTRVNFVSLLPRRGYVLVCPACRRPVAGMLGTLR